MKRNFLLIILGCVMLSSLPAVSNAQIEDRERRKLAQTGFKFLNVTTDARAAALSDAVTSLHSGAEAMFYNSAAMGWMQQTTSVTVGMVQWIADINYNHAGVAFRPADGRYGVFGATFLGVDYGDIQRTVLADTDERYIDLGTFSPGAWSVGLGYANAITERFSVGGNVKYVTQDLGQSIIDVNGDDDYIYADNETGVMAFDFGVVYHVGLESLNFALSIRNFSEEIRYVEESFQLPLTFRIGLSMNVMHLMETPSEHHQVFVSVDAERPRDYYEQVKIGTEYIFMNRIALRAGYVFPSDEEGIALGVGLRQPLGSTDFSFDYAYSDLGVFSSVHRFTFNFGF